MYDCEMDAGFQNQTYYNQCDRLVVIFVASGKMHAGVKEHVGQTETFWGQYHNARQVWATVKFAYRAVKAGNVGHALTVSGLCPNL